MTSPRHSIGHTVASSTPLTAATTAAITATAVDSLAGWDSTSSEVLGSGLRVTAVTTMTIVFAPLIEGKLAAFETTQRVIKSAVLTTVALEVARTGGTGEEFVLARSLQAFFLTLSLGISTLLAVRGATEPSKLIRVTEKVVCALLLYVSVRAAHTARAYDDVDVCARIRVARCDPGRVWNQPVQCEDRTSRVAALHFLAGVTATLGSLSTLLRWPTCMHCTAAHVVLSRTVFVLAVMSTVAHADSIETLGSLLYEDSTNCVDDTDDAAAAALRHDLLSPNVSTQTWLAAFVLICLYTSAESHEADASVDSGNVDVADSCTAVRFTFAVVTVLVVATSLPFDGRVEATADATVVVTFVARGLLDCECRALATGAYAMAASTELCTRLLQNGAVEHFVYFTNVSNCHLLGWLVVERALWWLGYKVHAADVRDAACALALFLFTTTVALCATDVGEPLSLEWMRPSPSSVRRTMLTFAAQHWMPSFFWTTFSYGASGDTTHGESARPTEARRWLLRSLAVVLALLQWGVVVVLSRDSLIGMYAEGSHEIILFTVVVCGVLPWTLFAYVETYTRRGDWNYAVLSTTSGIVAISDDC